MSAATLDFITPDADRWSVAPADAAIVPAGQLLLSWDQWREVNNHWPVGLAVAVVFPNDRDIGELLPDLPRLAMVALSFPKWTDGRAYSQARLLRSRHRYSGPLRATGDVIPDMAAQLHRTGFDEVVLRPGESVEVAQRMLRFFAAFYQADVHEPRLRFARTVASPDRASAVQG